MASIPSSSSDNCIWLMGFAFPLVRFCGLNAQAPGGNLCRLVEHQWTWHFHEVEWLGNFCSIMSNCITFAAGPCCSLGRFVD